MSWEEYLKLKKKKYERESKTCGSGSQKKAKISF